MDTGCFYHWQQSRYDKEPFTTDLIAQSGVIYRRWQRETFVQALDCDQVPQTSVLTPPSLHLRYFCLLFFLTIRSLLLSVHFDPLDSNSCGFLNTSIGLKFMRAHGVKLPFIPHSLPCSWVSFWIFLWILLLGWQHWQSANGWGRRGRQKHWLCKKVKPLLDQKTKLMCKIIYYAKT